MSKKLLFRLAVLVAAMMCALGASAAEAYACYTPSNTTLTFYYDNQRSSHSGTTYDLNTGNNYPGWYDAEIIQNVTGVVFAPSFAGARPKSTYMWFCNMYYLESIRGMEYLNTSEVTNMAWMFSSCTVLTSLDVNHFNTSKVTDMAAMFRNCSSLTSLDLSSFNTSNVTDMRDMFYICTNLQTIYVGNDWSTAAVEESDNMFMNCYSLVGGKGTTYDANHADAAYAHIDGGPSNPGYFTDKHASLSGDVDGDGSVSIADVSALIDYILDGDASGINLEAADVDGDDQVGIGDVSTITDYILTGNWD